MRWTFGIWCHICSHVLNKIFMLVTVLLKMFPEVEIVTYLIHLTTSAIYSNAVRCISTNMDCHDILYRHSLFPEEEAYLMIPDDISSSATIRVKF